MQVSIETTSGLERRLVVGVPAEEVDKEVAERLQKASKSLDLKGFRKGKVPIKVVRQRFGRGVRQEVVGEVVNRSFYDAIVKEDVRPAGQPEIEPLKDEPGQDLEYVATFEVFPEITLGDFAVIEVARPVAEVTEADVDAMIENLRQQRAGWETVDRAAAFDDRVNIDYRGTKDGEEFAGGTAEGSDLVLGSGRMIPGFENGIVGMVAGDEKTLELNFPDDYQAQELKGAAVSFAIKLNAVQEKVLPELNDELFAQFGVNEGGMDKFREDVRGNMERELSGAIKAKVKARLMHALRKMHQVEVPKALVSGEIKVLREQMMSQFGGGQQLDMSIFPDDLFTDEAERRVITGLLIAEIAKVAELEADSETVRDYIEERAAGYDQPEQVVQYYYSNQQLLAGVESAVMEDQVVEHVLAAARVTDQPMAYQEAIKPDPVVGNDEVGETVGPDEQAG